MIENRPGVKGWVAGALCAAAIFGCSSGSGDPDSASGGGAPAAASPAPAAAAPVITSELFVDVEVEPDEGPPPLAVQFTATIEDNEGPVECEWDFGDGSPKSTGLGPLHVYSTVADYEIIVRCRDSTGIEGEGETDVFVELDE